MIAKTLLLCATAFLCSFTHARTFVEVPTDDEVCFVETLRKGELLRGSYQVVSGGYLDVDLGVIEVKTKEKLVDQLRQDQGTFRVVARTDGDYKVCFGNKISSNSPKRVQFAVHAGVEDDFVKPEAHDLADVGHVDKVQGMIMRLGRRVSDLKEQEEYLRRRTERHHRTAESNHFRVLLSSICEAVVVVGVNLAQIHYLRNFFEVKRII